MSEKVLVFAAHPDDEILGLGGTLARHTDAGDEVTVIVASEGASSRYPDGTGSILEEACRAACKILGIANVRFLGFPDQRMDTIALLDVVQALEQTLREVAPEIVYAHHWGDANRDHRIISEAAMVACRPLSAVVPRRFYMFETPSSTGWALPEVASQFIPVRFVDTSATVERKLAAMACYSTELRDPPHPRSLESLRSRGQYWGQVSGFPYAEPFVVVRELA